MYMDMDMDVNKNMNKNKNMDMNMNMNMKMHSTPTMLLSKLSHVPLLYSSTLISSTTKEDGRF